jgi:hypothetical protein
MPDTPTAGTGVQPRTKLLGWSLIGLIGGGAAVASLLILALVIVIADVFVLETTPAQTDYLTIVRQKGTTGGAGGESWYIYELRDASGKVSDGQLPWAAQPGDRVRIRSGRTRILRLTMPTEGPVLCSAAHPCD